MGVKRGLCLTNGKHRLRVFENRMLSRIFRHKREEVAGGWRKLCNKVIKSIIRVTGQVTYEVVTKSFRTGRLERKPQVVQLFATRCSYIAIL
jgi:hypothetical protein